MKMPTSPRLITISGIAIGLILSMMIASLVTGPATAAQTSPASLAGLPTSWSVPTSTLLINLPSSQWYSQPLTLIARVCLYTCTANREQILATRGQVKFYDGNKTLGISSFNSNGTANLTVILPEGSHTISAAYSGDSTPPSILLPSQSSSYTVNIILPHWFN